MLREVSRNPGGSSTNRMLERKYDTCRAYGPVALLVIAVALAGCSSASASALAEPSLLEASGAVPDAISIPQDLARSDSQGAVEVTVVPLNLGLSEAEELEFEISMNTHSIDLSMDLARLSRLESDLGVRVAAGSWSGGSGHHVLGILRFPLRDSQGLAVLEGASLIVLRIEGVDAPVREFQWAIGQDQ